MAQKHISALLIILDDMMHSHLLKMSSWAIFCIKSVSVASLPVRVVKCSIEHTIPYSRHPNIRTHSGYFIFGFR